MKKLSFFALVILFLVSCSNDDTSTNATNPEVTITGYKIVSKSVPTDGSNTSFENVIIGNLQNGKLFSRTIQNFKNGVSQGAPETVQDNFYDGNLLSYNIDNNGDRKREFYYDSQNRPIGAKMTIAYNSPNPSYNFYRFVYVSNSKLYFERLSKSYDDQTAEIQFRNILEFDENNNIIKAGRDSNLDGVSENTIQYNYLVDNMTTKVLQNGTITDFNYSNIINTNRELYEKSYGKKLFKLLESETYTHPTLYVSYSSKNLLAQEIIDNTYEVLNNNFYKKKIQVETTQEFINTTTTEYFFN
jgi:hypothetical protein